MHDIMLFGSGWSGEVRKIEKDRREFTYIPEIRDPKVRGMVFVVLDYIAEDGNTYLVGCSENNPLTSDIEKAIRLYAPKPV